MELKVRLGELDELALKQLAEENNLSLVGTVRASIKFATVAMDEGVYRFAGMWMVPMERVLPYTTALSEEAQDVLREQPRQPEDKAAH